MKSHATDQRRSAIQEILLNDWDPHNAASNPHAHGTYDGYIEPLAILLATGATEEQIVAWLHEREAESMCFPSLGTRRLKPIAAKLAKLTG
jgi:hypothetical protein